MCNYFLIIFVDHVTHGMINKISKIIGILCVKVLLERLDTKLVSYCVSCYCCKTREYTRAATFTSCLLECDIWKPSMLTINSSRYHYWIHCVLAFIGQQNVQPVHSGIFQFDIDYKQRFIPVLCWISLSLFDFLILVIQNQ